MREFRSIFGHEEEERDMVQMENWGLKWMEE